MSIKLNQSEDFQTYFCTFTCLHWLHLFEITNLYDELYKWFNILTQRGNQIEGFVIMPNHVHLLLFINKDENINKLLGNGKRFLAYEIVNRLEQLQHRDILSQLASAVTLKEKERNKKHRVFEISSDIKACYTEEFFLQKLDYIHNNPVSGKWNLAATAEDYFHSSASFYTFNKQHPLINLSHYKGFGFRVAGFT